MASDLTVVQNALTEQIPSGLQAAVRFVAVLAILLVLHTRLTAVALLVVPPVVLFAIFLRRRLERVGRRSATRSPRRQPGRRRPCGDPHRAGVLAGGPGSRPVPVAARGPAGRPASQRAVVRRVQRSDDVLRLYRLRARVGVRRQPHAGRVALGRQADLVLLYTFSIGTSVGQLGALYAGYKRLRGSSARVFELLDQQSAIVDPPKPVKLAGNAAGLSVRSVGFCYEGEEQPALTDVSLEIAPGELVALVGPSGSGKSTLFGLLLRFYEAQQGEMPDRRPPLRDVALADLRRRMALVPQDIFLFSGSVAENIRLARPDAATTRCGRPPRRRARRRSSNAWTRLRNGGRRARRAALAGQRQRVAIARAFLRDPRILLLDEATSSLDPDSEATVQRAIEQLLEGRTTIVIAHRLATARRRAHPRPGPGPASGRRQPRGTVRGERAVPSLLVAPEPGKAAAARAESVGGGRLR